VIRDGAPTRLANVHTLQMLTRFWSGDLMGAEERFTAGLEFFHDPEFWHSPTGGVVIAFGTASSIAWMAWAEIGNKQQDVAFSRQNAATYAHARENSC
jgi:hypothetical protein